MIHPTVAARFPLLEGIDSIEQVFGDPANEERFHAYMQYREATAPPQVPTRDDALPGPHGPVPVRVYAPGDGATARPALVWLHGGAFMAGDLDMPEAERPSREVCARVGAVVVSVDYRLAVGGVTYPVPLDDCVAVVRWVRDHADELGVDRDRISVGGASAGACLAAGATLRLRDEDGWSPASLILGYAMVHPHLPPAPAGLDELMTAVPELLRFRPQSIAGVTANYLGGPDVTPEGYAMPALADLAGLCPTVLLNAEYDDLRASGQAFTAALAAAGVDVRQVTVRGMLHGFLNLPADLGPLEEAYALIADVVSTSRSVPSEPALA